MGLRRLTEIPRPYPGEATLVPQGEAVLINADVIIAYKIPRQIKYPRGRTLFIAREETKPVRILGQGSDRMYPHENPENRKGRFGVIFVPLVSNAQTVLVGEGLAVNYEIGLNDMMDLHLQSDEPIYNISYIDGRRNFSEYLRNLAR